MNTTLNSAGLSVQYSLTVAGNLCGVYTYNNEEYLKLTAPKSVSVSLDGTSVNFVAGSFYWFKLEPIRWRVSDFGVAQSSKPAEFVNISEEFAKKAVSDLVLDWGSITEGSVSERWFYTSSAIYSQFESNFSTMSNESSLSGLQFATEGSYVFDYFNSSHINVPVNTQTRTLIGVYQVSQDELNENFTNQCAFASDLVCMLSGISDTQFCNYWTRNLFNLNNGIYITDTGISRNRYMTSNCGIRLCYSALVPVGDATLKIGTELNAIMKNASAAPRGNYP